MNHTITYSKFHYSVFINSSSIFLFLIFIMFNTNTHGIIQINTIEDFQKIGNDPGYPLNGEYELTGDIDASDTVNWNDGAGFMPIGTESNPFTGKLYGNGYTISNLYINLPDEDHIGIFAYTQTSVLIQNLAFANASIIGKTYVGVLSGYNKGNLSNIHVNGTIIGRINVGLLTGLNSGQITLCSSTGYVKGNMCVGGLIGLHYNNVSRCYSSGFVYGELFSGGLIGMVQAVLIENCYSTSSIVGSSYIGGLIGYLSLATITNCYSAGAVTFLGNNAGGLTGYKTSYSITINNSFWDIETSGLTHSDGGVGKNTAQMQQQLTYTGWNFVETWSIEEGTRYPYLNALGPTQHPIIPEIEISTLEELNKIGRDINYPPYAWYTLTANIDGSETINWNNGKGFSPIPPLMGKFNGNNYTLSNFYMSDLYKYSYGLFICITKGAEVHNLSLENIWILGREKVGGLASSNYGVIDNCSIFGAIYGQKDKIGGLVGMNYGIISQSYSKGYLFGSSSVGGLVGKNIGDIITSYSSCTVFGYLDTGGLTGINEGTISKSYATGDITNTNDSVGGLSAINRGTILQSYSTGQITGVNNAGGFVANNSGLITDSYWDKESSGQETSSGGEGKTTAEMKQQTTYTNWDFLTDWEIENGITYPYLTSVGPTQDTPPLTNEIELNTPEDIQKIGRDWDYPWFASYSLSNDIDFDLSSKKTNSIFEPISLFAGTLNGNNHTIKNIHIYTNNPEITEIGFFSTLGHKGEVLNLIFENIWVLGYDYDYENVGTIAGYNSGTINRCFVKKGSILGYYTVGGLVGYNSSDNTSIISESYFIGNVVGISYIGGIVGYNESYISRCYSSGSVKGSFYIGGLTGRNSWSIYQCYATNSVTGREDTIGGLIGENSGEIDECYSIGTVSGAENTGGLIGINSGLVTDCYWDIQKSGQSTSSGGEGKTTEEMLLSTTYNDWDFMHVWEIQENITYPYFKYAGITETPPPTPDIEINSLEELNKIGKDWEYPWYASYKLMTDIDASETALWNEGAGFEPIPAFTGKLDGNGHTIKNLYINRPSENNIGLFREILFTSEISNLRLENCQFSGNQNVGGIAGYISEGTVSRCYVNGTFTPTNNNIGGIAGLNIYGYIFECFTSGTISGNSYIGGIVGNNNGNINNCYSTMSVTASIEIVGGLVGYNEQEITLCYSTGAVFGTTNHGGLIGKNMDWGIVSDCYWDIETSGQTTSNGGLGKTTAEMKQQLTFVDWDFVNTWGILDNETYPYLLWQFIVPNLKGLSLSEAENKITTQGLTIGNITYQCSDLIPEGFVAGQDPDVGQQSSPGTPVNLVVSTGSCSEGEGTTEGTPEGEGVSEGTTEGTPEGIPDGEGTTEGTPEGEGVSEGTTEGTPEGTPDGEGTAEGTPEGEGIAEGSEEGEKPPHSADPNGDWVINLSELLRVIQFFNTGGYHCEVGTEDGYAPGLEGDKSCQPHGSDYNPQDWQISLSELLRLIQFFNFGAYHSCPGVGEDGYCPGIKE